MAGRLKCCTIKMDEFLKFWDDRGADKILKISGHFFTKNLILKKQKIQFFNFLTLKT